MPGKPDPDKAQAAALRERLLADLPQILGEMICDIQLEVDRVFAATDDQKSRRRAVAFAVHKIAYNTMSVDEILTCVWPCSPARWKSPEWQAKLLQYALRVICKWHSPQQLDRFTPDDIFYILNRSLKPFVPRGGPVRLEWTSDKQLHFLDAYEAALKSVRDATGRIRNRDPHLVRVAALRAANDALPESEKLPGDIVEKIAARVGQKAAPTLQDLAIETAARRLKTDTNSYLIKILTKARKIRNHKPDAL